MVFEGFDNFEGFYFMLQQYGLAHLGFEQVGFALLGLAKLLISLIYSYKYIKTC